MDGNRGYFERVQSSPRNIAKMIGFTNLIISKIKHI